MEKELTELEKDILKCYNTIINPFNLGQLVMLLNEETNKNHSMVKVGNNLSVMRKNNIISYVNIPKSDVYSKTK